MEFTIENIPKILARLVGVSKLDLSDLTWIEPIGLGIVKALKDSINAPVVPPHNHSVLQYLDIMNLEEGSEAFPGRTYVPLHVLSNAAEIESITQKTVEKILLNEDFCRLSPTDADDFKDYLKYTISEMLDNAVEHSESNGVVSCAQYFPKRKKTQVAIVDTGMGFFRTISRNHPQVKNETEALELSLKAGVTGDQSRLYGVAQRHAGYGLYVLSKIIDATDGFLIMVSNNGMLIYKNGRTTLSTLSTQWTGSMVAFEINESEINYPLDQFFRIYIYPTEEQESEDEMF